MIFQRFFYSSWMVHPSLNRSMGVNFFDILARIVTPTGSLPYLLCLKTKEKKLT